VCVRAAVFQGSAGAGGGNVHEKNIRSRLSVWSSSSLIAEHSGFPLYGVEAASRAGSLRRAATSGLPNDAPSHCAASETLCEVLPPGKSATAVISMFTSGGASAVAAAAAADAALLTLPSSDKRTPSLPVLLLQPNGASVAPGMVSVSAA
jgi:hypothetical protein